MNCQEVREKIYKYCDGEVSPQEHASISLHLDKCSICRHICQLTLMENDVLREKDDIPELTPGFTSLVMNSLQSHPIGPNSSGDRFHRFKGKIWLGSTVAAAIVLFLYLPQLNLTLSPFLYSGKSLQQEQYFAPGTLTQYDAVNPTNQIPIPDTSKSITDITGNEMQSTESNGKNDNVEKSPAQIESTVVSPMVQTEDTVSSGLMNLGSGAGVNRSSSSDRFVVDEVVNDDIRPNNIPDRLKFVQVSHTGNDTVYNYASLDGKEYLQLTIKPYSDTTAGAEVELKSTTLSQATLTVSRNIQIEDKKMTVVLSGNLSLEELNKLADTIQFEDK